MTAKEYKKYEESRLGYLTDKAVLETARKEGEIRAKNLMIMNCIAAGLSLEMTAQISETTIEYVMSVIQNTKN